MISIQQNLTELELSHRSRTEALDCYLAAIDNVAHYAVELDTSLTAPHRKYLTDLAVELANASNEALAESRSTLRALLRDYHDKAALFMAGLRNQMSSTSSALQQMVEGLLQCDTDHTDKLQKDLGGLREVANSPAASPVSSALRALANSIAESLEQIRKQHQFTISQLQTELRLLHNRVDALETAAATDDVTKLSTRRFIAEYLEAIPAEGASLLILKMRRLGEARAKFGPAIADDVVGTFGRRLRNALPKDAVIGRWSEQDFVAIVPANKAADGSLVKRVTEHLSMPYACMMNGRVVRVPLSVTAECLTVAPGAGAEQVQTMVEEAFK